MNRRAFLSSLIGGAAATTVVRAFPFRVYSFASDIVVPEMRIVDSTGIFLIAELERRDASLHVPLSRITWDHDMFPMKFKETGKAQLWLQSIFGPTQQELDRRVWEDGHAA